MIEAFTARSKGVAVQLKTAVEELLSKVKSIVSLSPQAEDYLVEIAKEARISKGSVLIRQGDVVNKIYFVTGGCLRSYCVDQSGREHTLQFAVKDWWMSDYIALHNNERATLTVECLNDATVIEFNAQKLNEVLTLFPEYEPFQRYILERHVVSLHKRILNQMQLTASERYQLFLDQYPDIERHTRNYHIASFLGITQESLSRIRAEKVKR